MSKKALIVIDIQNDTHKNYKEIIGNINESIDWAVNNNIHVVYIRHENLSGGTKVFKPNTHGAELATDLKIVSENIFTKYKSNALTSEEFIDFINKNEICDFYLMGQMLLFALSQLVLICARRTIMSLSCRIALQVGTKRKSTKC